MGAPWTFGWPLALRSAARRWRSLLGMVVGVGVALALTITMMSMVSGSVWLYVGDFVESGVDLYVVRRGGEIIPVLPGDSPGTLRDARQVLARARALPEVREAIGVMTWPLRRTTDLPRRRAPVERVLAVGVDGDPRRISDLLALRSGRWLDRADEVVLGRKLADEKGLSVGDTLVLERRRLTVVGVGRLRGVGLAADGVAYLERGTHQELSGLGGRMNYLLVDAPDPAAAAARLRAEIDGIDVQDRDGVTRALDELMSRAMVIWQLIIGLTLVVAGVFVASMLLRSVGERRAELATLRAIGLPGRAVVALVLADALAVALAGSLLGIALSRLMGIGLDRVIAASLGMESIYRLDAAMVAQTVGVALALGALAALLPARSALRTEPADALREG